MQSGLQLADASGEAGDLALPRVMKGIVGLSVVADLSHRRLHGALLQRREGRQLRFELGVKGQLRLLSRRRSVSRPRSHPVDGIDMDTYNYII